MKRPGWWVVAGLFAVAAADSPSRSQSPQPIPLQIPKLQPQPTVPAIPSLPAAAKPRLEAVAETKLLMEALTQPNFRAVAKLLREPPKDADGWAFARGQSLLLAESANLLMLRPPKTRDAQDAWLTRAADLRDAATTLARATAAKDAVRSRAALAGVANACNRCHQTFRVAQRVNPDPAD